MLTVYLITFIINVIVVYLFRNSHDCYGNPLQLPLILWIAYIGVLLLPVVNLIFTVFGVVGVIREYANGDIKLNDDFWLNQKY